MKKTKQRLHGKGIVLLLLCLLWGGVLTANAEKKAWAKYDDSAKTFTFYYSDKGDLGENEYEMNTGTDAPGWQSQIANITKVVFDPSFEDARPTTCYMWFSNGTNIKTVEGIKYLNTSEVTDMNEMFGECWELTNLNLSSFNTQNVTDMSRMFIGCRALTNLDLSSFNTQNVTDMSAMFYGCFALANPNLSSFNTQNVTNMNRMFLDCWSITNPDLSSFNTQNVTDMSDMFWGCSKLTTLDLHNFDTQNVTDMSDMFINCRALTEIYASDKFTTSNVTYSSNMFKDCTSLKGDIEYTETNTDKTFATTDGGYFMDKQYIRPWVKYADGTLTFQQSYKKTISNEDGEYELNKLSDQGNSIHPDWVNNLRNVTKVVFDPSFADARPTTCYNWFQYGEKIKAVEGIEYLNTQEVTDMNTMFFRCSALTELNLSKFNTSKVKDMSGMFYGCSALTTLDLSNFNTQKVIGMNSMFYRCSALTTLNLSNFDTQKVTDMSRMFYGCKALTKLDLPEFDTRKVTNMKDMFNSCAKLKSLYLGAGFKRAGTDALFSSDMTPIIYSLPLNYADNKADFSTHTVKPYVPINARSEYGTICIPLGSKLAAGSYNGFDKLYTVKAADTAKGYISLAEATTIVPGVAYIYHRALAEDAEKSIITFEADDEATTASAPANNGNLLKGTFSRITAPGGSYILQTDGNFHPVAQGNTTLGVGAYRAYLDLPGLDNTGDIESNALRMVFGDATAINNAYTDKESQPKAYFDLSGRKVAHPQHGNVYISNGRKVVF